MTPRDTEKFYSLVGDVYAFYRQDYSAFAGKVWWQAMQPFDFAAVADAFNRHCVNPDSGQFMPKPADIVKMLQGSTQDAALVAWTKVDRAIRSVGTYSSVTFDDAIINRVITDMGGWIDLGTKTEDEWPFVRNDFVNRYRGYRMRNETPEHVPYLIGMAEAQNVKNGFKSQPPLLIGDAEKAKQVSLSGSDKALLTVTRAGEAAQKAVLRLVEPGGNA